MITNTLVILCGVIVLYFGIRFFSAFRLYLKLRGPRLLTCPETKEHVLVEVAAGTAAVEALMSEPCFRVHKCSRWPMHQDCGQDCLSQIEVHPSELRFSAACRSASR